MGPDARGLLIRLLDSRLALAGQRMHIYSLHKLCTTTSWRSGPSCMGVNFYFYFTCLTHQYARGHKVVLHDRPPQHFHRASPPEIHDVGSMLSDSIHLVTPRFIVVCSPAPLFLPISIHFPPLVFPALFDAFYPYGQGV